MCKFMLKVGRQCKLQPNSDYCSKHKKYAPDSESSEVNTITTSAFQSIESSTITDTTMCQHQVNAPIESTQDPVPASQPDLFDMIFDMKTGGPRVKELKVIEGSFCERFDSNKLAFIISNQSEIEKLFREEARNDLPLDKYYFASSNGLCPVTYNQNKGFHGRYYAHGSVSAQNMVREVRHTIFDDFYVDMDIDNAHPVFTVWLCGKLGIPCYVMESYVANRDAYMQELMDANGLTRGQAKMVYLSINFGGSSKYKDVKNKTQHLIDYFKESKSIQKSIAEKLPYFTKLTQAKREASGKSYNIEGSCLSQVCGFIENQILARMVEYLDAQIGYNVVRDSVLCFDGIMIPKGHFDSRFLPELEAIFSSMGVPLKLSMKKFEPLDLASMGYDPEKTYEYSSRLIPAIFDPADDRVFGAGFCIPAQESSWNAVHRDTLATVALIKNGGSSFFVTKVRGLDGPVEYTRTAIDKLCKSPLQALLPSPDPRGSGLIFRPYSIGTIACKTSEIDYDRIDFVPFSRRDKYNWSDRRVFNTFTGFVHDFEPSFKVDTTLIQRFLDHVRDVWCAGNEELFLCIIRTFALYVQRPETKTKICLVVTGREGVGKNIITDILRDFIIGMRYVCETATMAKVTGRFNAAIESKLLCVLNEAANVSGEGAHEAQEVLKDRIDAETILIERKGIDPYTVSDRCNYICFSNNTFVIKASTELRRYVFLEASDVHIGDTRHFRDLAEDFSQRGAGPHLYHYLMSLDLTGFVPQRDFPSTGLKEQMRAEAIDRPIQWMIACLNDEIPDHQSLIDGFNPVKVMLERFNVWADARGDKPWTSTRFGRSLSKILGEQESPRFNKIRVRGYTLDRAEMRSKLISYTQRPELFE